MLDHQRAGKIWNGKPTGRFRRRSPSLIDLAGMERTRLVH